MRYLKDYTLQKVSGGTNLEENNDFQVQKLKYKQFSATQKCPIGCFIPKSIQHLDICDNCKFGKRPDDSFELVTCTKIIGKF